MAKWFCLIEGNQIGPIESAKVKQLAEAGTLKPQHKVRREDMAEWHEAREVKGLFAVDHATPGVAAPAEPPKPERPQPVAGSAPPRVANQIHPGPTAVEATPVSAGEKNSSESQLSASATVAAACNSAVANMLSTTKGKTIGCGCLLVLFVMMLPAIQAAREAARRHSASAPRKSDSRVDGSQRLLPSFESLPPPIEEAIAAGNDVWLLHDHPILMRFERSSTYIVLDGKRLVKVVSKSHVDRATAKAMFKVDDESVVWNDWELTRSTASANSGASKWDFAFQSSPSNMILTMNMTGDADGSVVTSTYRTTITLDIDNRRGSWESQETTDVKYGGELKSIADRHTSKIAGHGVAEHIAKK